MAPRNAHDVSLALLVKAVHKATCSNLTLQSAVFAACLWHSQFRDLVKCGISYNKQRMESRRKVLVGKLGKSP